MHMHLQAFAKLSGFAGTGSYGPGAPPGADSSGAEDTSSAGVMYGPASSHANVGAGASASGGGGGGHPGALRPGHPAHAHGQPGGAGTGGSHAFSQAPALGWSSDL